MIVGGVLIFLAAVYLLVSFLIARGITTAERNPQEDGPAAYGLSYEDVTFTPRDAALSLEGWYFEARGAWPTVIFVHGLGSKRTGDKAMEVAARLIDRGYGALLFDLRGHGSSEGGRTSGGLFERQDVLGAFDFVRERGVPADRIGLLGFSMGAATAVLAAADEPEIRAAVLDSPYAKATDFISQEAASKTVLPKWGMPVFIPTTRLIASLLYDINLGAMIPERSVRDLDFPVLVIHGTADGRVPFEHGVRVHQAAPQGSELWLVPGADHVDAFIAQPEEYVERVTRYFETTLGLSGPPA